MNQQKSIFDKRSFLVVDDMQLSRMNVVKLLNQLGEKITTYNADNGMHALDQLTHMAKNVDCIISDFEMPVMNGLQLLKAVRMGYKNISNAIPFVMLTSHKESSLVTVAIVLDVDAFIVKPPNRDILEKKITTIFQENRTSDDLSFMPADYACIDIEREIDDIQIPKPTVSLKLKRNESDQLSVDVIDANKKKDECNIIEELGDIESIPLKQANFEEVPVNSILVEGVESIDGKTILPKDTFLTRGMIRGVKNLIEIGVKLKPVCYQSYRTREEYR
jgi:CheY-like chemotaxis protein